MGIKSTYDIDRATAIAVIYGNLQGCSNEELADILEAFKQSEFRNYIVHDQLPEQREGDRIMNASTF